MEGFKSKLLLFVLSVFCKPLLLAQPEPYKVWMFTEITKDSTFVGNIYSETAAGTSTFYWPKDLPLKRVDVPVNGDHLIKTPNGIFTVIEGTGRVYQIELDPQQKTLNFIRHDSSLYFGYNYGAYVFFNQDTIYSLGGYGLWNFSWHLRYFRSASAGWELLPLNTEVIPGNGPRFNYLSEKSRNYYSIETGNFKEGLKESHKGNKVLKRIQDSTYIFKLDLTSKNWATLGILTPEFREIHSKGYFACDTPFGKILTSLDKHGNRGILIDFESNKIFEAGDKKLMGLILDALLSGKNNSNPPERRLVYFHQDSIKILNSNFERFAIKISREDFLETPIKIWNPVEESSWNGWLNDRIFLLIGLLTFTAGLWLFYISKPSDLNSPESSNFDKLEIKLLLRIATNPNLVIKPEEIDQLFESGAQSPDALKKRRSLLIRSINKKYSDQFDDEEELVRTERLESDRRMVQYIMDGRKYGKAQKTLKELKPS